MRTGFPRGERPGPGGRPTQREPFARRSREKSQVDLWCDLWSIELRNALSAWPDGVFRVNSRYTGKPSWIYDVCQKKQSVVQFDQNLDQKIDQALDQKMTWLRQVA